MSNVTIGYLGQIAPEYKNFSDTARFNTIKAAAENIVSQEKYGDQTDIATAYAIAHMLKVGDSYSSGSGGGGSLKREKTDKIEREYFQGVTGSTSEWGSTPYGLEFLRISKTLITSPIFYGLKVFSTS